MAVVFENIHYAIIGDKKERPFSTRLPILDKTGINFSLFYCWLCYAMDPNSPYKVNELSSR